MESGWKKYNLLTGRELSPNDPQNEHVFGTAAWTKKNSLGRIKNNQGQILFDPTKNIKPMNTNIYPMENAINLNTKVGPPANLIARNNTSGLRIKAPKNNINVNNLSVAQPNLPLMRNNIPIVSSNINNVKPLIA